MSLEFPKAEGWDRAAEWGSPDGQKLIAALQQAGGR